jgi:hypothetical protein
VPLSLLLTLEPNTLIVGMINSALPAASISTIAIASIRNALGIGSSGCIIFPHLKSSMEFFRCGGKIEKIRRFMRSG